MPRVSSRTLLEAKDLARIVSKLGQEKILVPSRQVLARSNSRYASLFRLLQKKATIGERELAASIGFGPSDPRYRAELSRLKTLLLRALFFLDFEGSPFSEYAREVYRLRRSAFLAHTLRSLGARSMAERLALRALKGAVRLEEYAVGMELLSILRAYSALRGESEELVELATQSRNLLALLNAEVEAELAVQHVQAAFSHSATEMPALLRQTDAVAIQTARLAETYGGFKLPFLSIRLQAMRCQIGLEYEQTIAICDRAMDLLSRFPIFDNRTRRAEFALKRLVCHLQLREYEDAERDLEECRQYILEDETAWFNLKEYEYLLRMHTKQFRNALLLCGELKRNARYPHQPQITHERWDLFELYAEYVNGLQIPLTKADQFLAYLPKYSTDKAGFNVSVLILHILVLLERKDLNGVADRIEALKIYRKRYLRTKEGEHAEIFFRLLFMLIRADFKKEKVLERGEDLLQKYRGVPVLIGLQILPFDQIWERVLASL